MQLLKRITSLCDVMNIFKITIGIVIIAAGVYYQNWLGVIGLWPIVSNIIAWRTKRKQACAVEFNRSDRKV